MQISRESWIRKNTWCRVLNALFRLAAENLPSGYANRPWRYQWLDHGKAVLTSAAQLNCYTHAYGLMHVYTIWVSAHGATVLCWFKSHRTVAASAKLASTV